MRCLWTTLLVLGVSSMLAPIFGQEPSSRKPESPVSEETHERIESLIQALGHEDYEARDRAYEDLRALGAVARPQLEKATKSEDPEIRWRAGRLLRAIASGEPAASARSRRPAEDVERRRSRRPERRAPEPAREEDQDHQAEEWTFRGVRDWPGMDEGVRRHLSDLQNRMQEMQREMDRLMREGLKREPQDFSRSRTRIQILQDGSRLSLRADESGVEATVTEKRDGKEVTETYRAKDLDEFKAVYPEVARRFGLDRMRIELSPAPPAFPSLPALPRGPSLLRRPPGPMGSLVRPGAEEGPRLGVVIAVPSPELAEHLGLEEGEGLLVREVEPKSLAEALGIQKSDILLDVNEEPIGAPEDVREALSSTRPRDEVTVRVLRRGRTETLSAKMPSTSR